MKSNRGFTLIEILIVVIILGIVSVIIVASSSRQVSYYAVQKTSANFVSLLQKAQSRSLNSYKDLKHSVKVETNQAILFEGTSYSSSDPDNIVLSYDSGVTASTISINGGGDIITFEKVTGSTSDYGTVKFTLTSASTSSSTVTISEAGVIYN